MQSCALLHVQRGQQFLDHVLRQVGRNVSNFVGVEGFGGGQQLVTIHGLDERLANRVGHFEQDFAVVLGLDQIPDQSALVERQGFEDVGDVSRMQLLQLALQFGEVLLVDEVFHQVLTRPALLVDELFHQPHPAEQGLHLREMRFERVLRLVFEGVGHGRGRGKPRDCNARISAEPVRSPCSV